MASIWLEVLWKGQAATRGIAQTKKEVGELKTAWSEVWAKAGGLSGVTGILGPIALAVEAIQGVRKAVRAGVDDFQAWESASVRTAGTLENLGIKGEGAFEQIKQAVDKVVETTRFGDDQLLDAANRLIEDTQDYQASLRNLSTVADLAAAKNLDLATSEAIVAKVMEGNNRAVGQMLPFMRTYAETLDGVANPAERAALMLAKLQESVAGKAANELKTSTGAWLDFKDAVGDTLGELTSKSGVLPLITAQVRELTHELHAMQNPGQEGNLSGFDQSVIAAVLRAFPALAQLDAKNRMDNQGPFVSEGANMVAHQQGTFDALGLGNSMLGPGNEEGIAKFQTVVEEFHQAIAKWSIENGISDDRQSMRRPGQRGRAYSPLQPTGPGREFSLDEDALNAPFQRVKEIGQFVQTTISGAIVAGGTSGFDGFLASLKQTGLQALADLLGGALANIFAPGAGIGGGILGSIFGLGSSKSGLSATVERNLARRQLRLA